MLNAALSLLVALLAVSAPASALGDAAPSPCAPSTGWSPRRTSWPRRWASRSCGTAATRWTPRWPPPSRSRSRIPTAGNIGGGGFLLYRPAGGEPVAYDFRETAPAGSSPTMFLTRRQATTRSATTRATSSVGVPGTVAGLHMAWKAHGKLPWRRLLEPAIALARDGFMVTRRPRALAAGRAARDEAVPGLGRRSSRADGVPYETGDLLQQPDLARTLRAHRRPRARPGSTRARPRELIEKEMKAGGGLITRADLEAYQREDARAPARHLPRVRRAGHAPHQLRRDRAPRRC